MFEIRQMGNLVQHNIKYLKLLAILVANTYIKLTAATTALCAGDIQILTFSQVNLWTKRSLNEKVFFAFLSL